MLQNYAGIPPIPVPSFYHPVPIPSVSPDDRTTQISVCFSSVWLPYIIGALSQLILPSTWEGTQEQKDDAIQQAVLLRSMLNVGCRQPAQIKGVGGVSLGMEPLLQVAVEDGQCVLQYRCCVGDPWITLATSNQVGQGGQPGGGATQPSPGGGQACYHAILNTNSQWFLPTKVSAGDVISISNGSGATSNSHDSEWRCIDGEQFFAGACVGYNLQWGTDPVPTADNGTLVAKINGVFYSLKTPLTVPGGVSDASVVIQVNDAVIAGLSGSFTFDACVTNNQVGTWIHTFDFTSGQYGFTAYNPGTARAAWALGVGWSPFDANNLGVIQMYAPRFPATSINTVEAHFSSAAGGPTPSLELSDWNMGNGAAGVAMPAPSVVVVVPIGNVYSGMFINFINDPASPATYPYGGALTKLIFTGTGADPF